MWVAAAYFDESDDNDRACAIGGFIGHQLDCVHLDWAWKERVLDEYQLEYFKASELEWGVGQFAKFRDNPNDLHARFSDREKNLFREIKTVTIDIFLEADLLWSFGAVVVLPDYYRLLEEFKSAGLVLPAPYYFCAQVVYMESGFIMDYQNEGRLRSESGCVSPVYDRQKEYQGSANQIFEEFREKNPLCSKWLLPPRYEDDQDYVVLQVADNLVYEMRRLVVGEEFNPHIPERKAMTRLKERLWKVYKLNYEGLKKIMDRPANVVRIKPEIYNPRKGNKQSPVPHQNHASEKGVTMPERIYFDTVAFREVGKAFEKSTLPTELRDRILISPLTVFEVLSQLTIAKADEVLQQVHATLNWTNPKYTGLLPWPDDALFSIWFKKPAPDDGFTERMQKAFNACLAAESAKALQDEAGKLKDVMDRMKDKTAQDFGRLLQAARKEGLEGEKFSQAWFQDIANRIKAESKSRDMSEIVSALNAYHEFERGKLQVALGNKDYNPEKHKNDLLDAEQLIYLSDPSLCFLTCDKGFANLVKNSPQAKRVITVSPEELVDPGKVETLIRGIS
jgi:hypothetical protein